MSTSYSTLLTRGNSSQFNSLSAEDGKIRFVTDTRELYIDYQNAHIKISDIVRDYTQAEILALPVASILPNKVYFSSDTHQLYYYNTASSAWANMIGSHTHMTTDIIGLGTAAVKDVPTSGNASTTQVVMGDDTRLTDSRNAADVYDWAKAETKPSYTASEVGLGNVGNFKAVSTVANQGLTTTEQANARANIGASALSLGETSSTAYYGDKGKTAYDHSQSTHARTDATAVAASTTNGNILINGTETAVYAHPGTGTNPHGTTKSDVGLGNVDNTSDTTKKSNFTGSIASENTGFVTGGAVYTALTGKLDTTLKGANSGLAELDANGKVPSSQLPSYVDDVLEYNNKASFPTTGEAGKIYIAKDTNKTYRWSGSAYTEISESLALGTTSSTAYRGDYGNTAYGHATDSGRLTTATTSGLYKLSVTAEGHVGSVTVVGKSDITALGIPASDTNTHRPIQVNGTQNLGDNVTALNLKNGTNVTITADGGNVTIAATDTKYESKAAASGGTDVSLVTTGEKYTWNNKTSNTGTVTKVSTGVGLTGGDVTTTGTIKCNLKNGDTKSSLASNNTSSTANRQYAVEPDSNGKLSVNVPWSDNNTWKAQSSTSEGYVASSSGKNNCVWATNGSAAPSWMTNPAIDIDGGEETS